MVSSKVKVYRSLTYQRSGAVCECVWVGVDAAGSSSAPCLCLPLQLLLCLRCFLTGVLRGPNAAPFHTH